MSKRTVFIPGTVIDLVLLEEADAAITHHWFNDRSITRFLSRGAYPMTEAACAAYYLAAAGNKDQIVLGLWHKVTAELIGTIGLHDIDQINQTAELGIVIGNQQYHGQGIGSAAITALTEHAFAVLNLRNVTLRVLGNNERGQRCYQRLGFQVTGRRPEQIYKDGIWVDEIAMTRYRPTRGHDSKRNQSNN